MSVLVYCSSTFELISSLVLHCLLFVLLMCENWFSKQKFLTSKSLEHLNAKIVSASFKKEFAKLFE